MARQESAPPPGPPAGALDPSSALSVDEAATLAGVEPAEIEGRIADGSLLSERQRVRAFGGARRERVVVRLLDLADVYPRVLGRPDPVPASAADGPSVAAEPPTAQPDPGESDGAPRSRADGAASGSADAEPEYILPRPDPGGAEEAHTDLASGAPRAALVQLCEDLEVRLDLAEKERQASTASLLMAQRRVLDLEADARRRPLRAYTQFAALAVAGAALVVALNAPDRAARAASEAVDAAGAPIAARVEEALDASARATRDADTDRAAFLDAFADRTSSRVEELEANLARALDESRTAREALAASLMAAGEEQRTAATSQAERSREERALLDERLRAAESLLEEARAALETERAGRAEDARTAATNAASTREAVERLEAALGAERAALGELRSDWAGELAALRTDSEALRRESEALRAEAEERRASAQAVRLVPWFPGRGVRAPW